LEDIVVIGKVLKELGICGELKVLPLSDNPERFKKLERVYLVSPDGKRELRGVTVLRQQKGLVHLSLAGCNSPEKASTLRGYFLAVPKNELPLLPEGKYYTFQIIGLRVVTDEGIPLGIVEDILSTGSNDVFVVKGEKEYLIPFLRDVVKKIDLAEKLIIIHPMAGLLE